MEQLVDIKKSRYERIHNSGPSSVYQIIQSRTSISYGNDHSLS